MTTPRNRPANTRGRPFGPGNPGKPVGARNRATIAAAALLDGEAEALTRTAIDKALEGDTVALRLCLERLVPPRKERPIAIDLPAVTGAKDHPAEHRRSVEIADVIGRLEALEGRTGQ